MPLIGYDTANGDFIVPSDAQFVVCYGDLRYENEAAARRRFPELFAAGRAVVLTAAGALWVNPDSGDDIEPGNRGPDTVVGYVQGEHSRGVLRPDVYADLSDMTQCVHNLEAAGIRVGPAGPGRPWRMHTAHPNGIQHTCGPHNDPRVCDFPWEADITQFWWDSIQGPWHGFRGDLDVNLARDDAFTVTPQPPKPEEIMGIAAMQNHDGRLEVFVEAQDGSIWHTFQLEDKTKWNGNDAQHTARLSPLAPAPGK